MKLLQVYLIYRYDYECLVLSLSPWAYCTHSEGSINLLKAKSLASVFDQHLASPTENESCVCVLEDRYR